MQHKVSRRTFFSATGAALAAAALPTHVRASVAPTEKVPTAKKRIKKAVKFGMVAGELTILEKFKLLSDMGFDGVELNSPNNHDPEVILRARDETGLIIHGVVDNDHWTYPLSDADPDVRARGVASLETALRDCRRYGGTTVLLVPAVVNKKVSYLQAYERSQQGIRSVLPLAKELSVTIAVENVWNNFLLSPLEAARYIDGFESPWIGWYFDVGNIVNYGWPEQWVKILGKRIIKLDFKEFSRGKRDREGLWKGFDVELLEGDCDWPAVMAALDAVGYEGWATAEIPGGDAQRLKDIAQRMDRIIALIEEGGRR